MTSFKHVCNRAFFDRRILSFISHIRNPIVFDDRSSGRGTQDHLLRNLPVAFVTLEYFHDACSFEALHYAGSSEPN